MTTSTSVTCAQCGQSATGNFCNSCGAPLQDQPCPRCDARLSPGARFCHLCGTPLGRLNSSGDNPLVKNAGWIAAGVLMVALVVIAATSRSGPSRPIPGSPVPVAAAPAPDISSMTPRERADRLFNRIISANERGLQDTVAFFTPMALQAYGLLGALDSDGRYHVGLIQALAGNDAAVAAQLDTLQTGAPDHLLGFMLAYALSSLRSDTAGSAAALAAFRNAYETEMASGLPEYLHHRVAIDAFFSEPQR